MRRTGHTDDIRIHDFPNLTIGLDLHSPTPRRRPEVFVTRKVAADTAAGWTYRTRRVTLPTITWAQAYRSRRFGGLRLLRWQDAALRAVTRSR